MTVVAAPSFVGIFPPLATWGLKYLLTKTKGCTGEYWPEVMAVQTECNNLITKMTKDQYSQYVQLEQGRLVGCLLYGA